MYLRKATAQNPTIYIAYSRNMSEDTKLFLTRTIPHKYSQLSQLTSKLLANTQPIMQLSKPLISCIIPRMNSMYLKGFHVSKTVQSKYRSFSNCMHDLYNSVNHITDNILSLHSSLNWVFLKLDLHEFLMRESLVNQSDTCGCTSAPSDC